MKNFLPVFLILTFLFARFDLEASALSQNDIISETAVLIDAATGQVLFDKDMHKKVYPASTTKILTGILTVENAYPAEIVTASAVALDLREPDGASISLTVGEEMTVDSAMYAMMLPSANDAANVLAEHIAGDLQTFTEMMNAKAKAIGAVNSHFANAHGLHNEDHYTTAYDMALITRYAAGDKKFLTYFGKDYFTMPATNKRGSERRFNNYQSMLLESSNFYYPDVIGGKVGFTNAARNTMSTVARRDGRTLVAVVMGSPYRDDKFTDTKKLLDFGFDEFVDISVGGDMVEPFEIPINETGGGEYIGRAIFRGGAPKSFLIHRSADPDDIRVETVAPEAFERGDHIAAEAVFYLTSEEEAVPELIGRVQLTVGTEIDDVVTASLQLGMRSTAEQFSFKENALLIALAIGLTACAFLIIWLIARFFAIRRKRRARMRRLRERIYPQSHARTYRQ